MDLPGTRSTISTGSEAVNKRLQLLDKDAIPVPPETAAAMDAIHREVFTFADSISSIVTKAPKFDTGRMINALDLLAQLKESLYASLSLPYTR